MFKKYMFIYNFFFNYPTPTNLTYVWNFGVISFIFFLSQFLTGFFLSIYYSPNEAFSFMSVEYMMSEVEYGWLMSYMHSNGASFFFFFVFAHTLSNLYYFSFLNPSYQMWNMGVLMLLLMMVTAFTGYVLPWGQMSFWAATVITNLFSAMPYFGDFVIVWLWGGFSVSGITLNSFFSMHFMLPMMMFVLMMAHFVFLHEVGSSNNLRMSKTCDKVEFHPYYTFKDVFVTLMILLFFFAFMGFAPNYLSHPDNYIPADPLTTPAHMVPEWYFLLFYAMLRSVPSKLGGVIVLFFSMLILFIFPHFMKLFFSENFWKNDKSGSLNDSAEMESLKSLMEIYDFKKFLFFFFVFTVVVLSVLGSKPVEVPYLLLSSIFTFFYFMYFFFMLCYIYVLTSSKKIADVLNSYISSFSVSFEFLKKKNNNFFSFFFMIKNKIMS